MIAKRFLIKLNWMFASQLGLDLQRLLRSLYGLPLFLRDWMRFRKIYSGSMVLVPCLSDRYEEGGTTKSEYFWQDLLVARWICEARPEKHVDVGSRVDGFVAHVASFREIEVFDVRPITSTIHGIVFKQANLMQCPVSSSKTGDGYCDSLSCLHALEHFGLGRYGDPIDPFGYEKGIKNMAALLKSGGTFYLSTPIGRERVEFNANRVFDPRTILRLSELNGMALRTLTVVDGGGQVFEVNPDPNVLRNLADAPYHLGIFTFLKK